MKRGDTKFRMEQRKREAALALLLAQTPGIFSRADAIRLRALAENIETAHDHLDRVKAKLLGQKGESK